MGVSTRAELFAVVLIPEGDEVVEPSCVSLARCPFWILINLCLEPCFPSQGFRLGLE